MQTSCDRTHLCLSSCCCLVLHAILIKMLEQRMLRIRSILRDRCMFRLHVHAWKPCTCSYACRRCSRRSSKYLAHAPSNACLRSLWEIHDIINASSPGGAVLNLYKPHTSLLKRRRFNIINASSPGGAVLNLYKPHTSLLKRRHLCPCTDDGI